MPTEVTTSLGDAKADGVSVATLVLVAVIALFAFKFMRKGL
ncbi:major capsid protein [Mycobacterium tuberculosis]